jgi:hypothetical protein
MKKGTGNFIIATYLIYSIATDFLITPIVTGITKNHILGLRFFTVLEFLFFVLFISYNIKSPKSKTLFLLSIPLLLIIAFIDYSVNPSNQFDSLPSGIAAIIGIALCIYCLFLLIRKISSIFLYQIPLFWFLSGIFIFYSGTLFLFLLSQQNLDNQSFAITFIIINGGFSILRNTLFSIAFTIPYPKELNKKSFL